LLKITLRIFVFGSLLQLALPPPPLSVLLP